MVERAARLPEDPFTGMRRSRHHPDAIVPASPVTKSRTNRFQLPLTGAAPKTLANVAVPLPAGPGWP
jgi:hypothetical protein